MSKLLDLAARVEALSGPDREVDALIGVAVGAEGCPHGPARSGVPAPAGSIRHPQYAKSWLAFPHYTASLDVAMLLVPEGAGFNLDRYWIREGVRWKVEIGTGGIPEQPRQVFDCWDAYTAPLATVAAALRARSAEFGNIGADGVQS